MPASFAAAQQVPAPAQVATLEREPFPDLYFAAEQVVEAPTQRARLVLATWRGPAEPSRRGCRLRLGPIEQEATR